MFRIYGVNEKKNLFDYITGFSEETTAYQLLDFLNENSYDTDYDYFIVRDFE